jgi:hypothetical protein
MVALFRSELREFPVSAKFSPQNTVSPLRLDGVVPRLYLSLTRRILAGLEVT